MMVEDGVLCLTTIQKSWTTCEVAPTLQAFGSE